MSNFDYFKNVEDFYLNNNNTFENLEGKMSASFNIPENIFRDAIKRSLFEILKEGPKKKLQENKVSFKDCFFYFATMLFFLLNAIFGLSNKQVVYKKIVFEMWDLNGYDSFYKSLLRRLGKDITLLYITNYHKKFKAINFNFSTLYSKKYIFNKSVSKDIFKSQFFLFNFYYKISKELEINFIYVVLNMFRHIAMYSTHSKQINCHVLFSAGDNYYNSLRYFLYKKNGIKNIALLQNGLRTGKWTNETVDVYTYCDYYFGFGVEQINVQAGMHCPNKMPVGSVKLGLMLDQYKNYKKTVHFDIVFLASYEERDTCYIKVDTYNKIIENLCNFSINNPNYKIFYSDKKRKNKSVKYMKMIQKIQRSGIVCSSSNIDNSYNAILCSDVCLFYRTTIGLEALAMGKMVLNINYDESNTPMLPTDEIAVLKKSSYKAFEERLLLLTSSKIKYIDYKYKELSNDYMNNNFKNNDIEDLILNAVCIS